MASESNTKYQRTPPPPLPEELRAAVDAKCVRYIRTTPPKGTHVSQIRYNTPESRRYVALRVRSVCSDALEKLYTITKLGIRRPVSFLAVFNTTSAAHSEAKKIRCELPADEARPSEILTGTQLTVCWPEIERISDTEWKVYDPEQELPSRPMAARRTNGASAANRMRHENQAVSGVSLNISRPQDQDEYEPPEVISGSDAPEDTDEVNLRVRYFGESSRNTVLCLCCGQSGHNFSDCPSTMCGCGVKSEHFRAGCPLNKRCNKCRETGHDAGSCPEKLKKSVAADGITCSLCSTSGHGEEECPSIWTTFYPDLASTANARPIQPMCYCCGHNTHWGDDCPRLYRGTKLQPSSFSAEYASRLGWEPSQVPAAHPSHKSKNNASKEQESSEEEVTFLRGAVANRNPNPPKMTMNLTGTWADAAGGRTDSSSSDMDTYSPPPAHNLPPRPLHPQGQSNSQPIGRGRGRGIPPSQWNPLPSQDTATYHDPPRPRGHPPPFLANARDYQNVPPPPSVRSGQTDSTRGRGRRRGGKNRGGQGRGH